MKRRYSRAFTPPAPMVELRVRAPGGAERRKLEAKIDSGADLCIVPDDVVAELDLPPVRTVRAAGFDGAHREALLYHCSIELAGHHFPHVEALATRRRYTIVGRNVLQALVVRLDGPGSTLSIERPRVRRKARR
jgi:predicted aspartyl protease